MRIHHFNCATFRPPGGRFVNGNGGRITGARIVCHCLLVEAGGRLLLVDTGLGITDLADPGGRLGAGFALLARARLDPEETAASRVARLGFRPEDVGDVALTHLDLDHAGGLADFPRARIHVSAEEHAAAGARHTFFDRRRYRPAHWAHGPDWVLHRGDGSRWFDLECAGRLEGFPAEVVLVRLPGHSAGHCGVAVRDGSGWLLHAGDAYFFHGELDPARPRCPLAHAIFQGFVAADRAARVATRDRLCTLVREHGGEVRAFCSHDVAEFEKLAAGGSAAV